MSLQHHLRQRESGELSLNLVRNRFPGSEVTRTLPEERYLPLLLEDERQVRAQVWLNVDVWLREMGIHLPDIPWQEVPLSYLARWLEHLKLSFFIGGEIWEVIKIDAPGSTLPEKALLLPAEPCPLMCLDWPDSGEHDQDMQTAIAGRVPFYVRYVLGYSQLTLGQLADVTPGDLLLIKEDFACLTVGNRRLYKLSYHPDQEVIVEEQLAERYQEYQEEEVLDDWANLPVDIEFMLDGRTMNLAELDAIRPGMALALNPNAEQNIKVYLNKKCFARGELVALENGTLAVEVNHVNSTLVGNAEESDAE